MPYSTLLFDEISFWQHLRFQRISISVTSIIKQCLQWCHIFWDLWISQNHKNLDIFRTKHHFLFKSKNWLIKHQRFLYGKKIVCGGGNLEAQLLPTTKSPKHDSVSYHTILNIKRFDIAWEHFHLKTGKNYDKVNLSMVMVLNAVNGNRAYKRSVYQAKQMLEKVLIYWYIILVNQTVIILYTFNIASIVVRCEPTKPETFFHYSFLFSESIRHCITTTVDRYQQIPKIWVFQTIWQIISGKAKAKWLMV